MTAAAADVTGYIFIAGSCGLAGSMTIPLVKAWIKANKTSSLKSQAQAKEWLKQFKPEQIAVIKNYLEHGGYSAGVSATIGDLNFLMLSQPIGETLRQCPELLDSAMFPAPEPQT